jgi:RNA polymerase sigma-70 factor (ECF subfamily)
MTATVAVADSGRAARQWVVPMCAELASERVGRLPRAGVVRGRGERALIREAQRGSADALEELFRRHWRRAHRAAYLVCGDATAAEDIAQESFLAAIRALDRFDRRRPFGPWLHRIAVNRAIDYARARGARPEQRLDAAPEPSTEGDPGGGLSETLLDALHGLSPEHRAVVVLRYVLEHTPGEIAEMLELPRGTVNSRLRRALDRLRPAAEEEAPR